MRLAFRRSFARFVLLFLFIAHLFKRAFFFWKKPPGLKNFLDKFSQDAIFPLSVDERARMPHFQKCIACSFCSFSCVAIGKGKAPSGFEPKLILLGFGRSAHESEYFLEEWLPCYECSECTVECPNDVPIHEMARYIVQRRDHVVFRKGA